MNEKKEEKKKSEWMKKKTNQSLSCFWTPATESLADLHTQPQTCLHNFLLKIVLLVNKWALKNCVSSIFQLCISYIVKIIWNSTSIKIDIKAFGQATANDKLRFRKLQRMYLH